MAIFGNKKEEKKEKKPVAKKAAAKKTSDTQKVSKKTDSGASGKVLLRPRITEKAAHLSGQNVYTFDVVMSATKGDIASAIEAVYRVKPVKVNLVKTAGKRVSLRTRRGFGRRAGQKKAYVYLKQGDRIEFAS